MSSGNSVINRNNQIGNNNSVLSNTNLLSNFNSGVLDQTAVIPLSSISSRHRISTKRNDGSESDSSSNDSEDSNYDNIELLKTGIISDTLIMSEPSATGVPLGQPGKDDQKEDGEDSDADNDGLNQPKKKKRRTESIDNEQLSKVLTSMGNMMGGIMKEFAESMKNTFSVNNSPKKKSNGQSGGASNGNDGMSDGDGNNSDGTLGNTIVNNNNDPVSLFRGNRDRSLHNISKSFIKLKNKETPIVLQWTMNFEQQIKMFEGWKRLVLDGIYTKSHSDSFTELPAEVMSLYVNKNTDFKKERERWIEVESWVDALIKGLIEMLTTDVKEVNSWFISHSQNNNSYQLYSQLKTRFLVLTIAEVNTLKTEVQSMVQGDKMSIPQFVDAINNKLMLISSGDKSFTKEQAAAQRLATFKHGVGLEFVIFFMGNPSFEESYNKCLEYEESPQYKLKRRGSNSISGLLSESSASAAFTKMYCRKCKRTTHNTEDHRSNPSHRGVRPNGNNNNNNEHKENHNDSNKVFCFKCGRDNHVQPNCTATSKLPGFTPKVPNDLPVKQPWKGGKKNFKNNNKRKRSEANNTQEVDEAHFAQVLTSVPVFATTIQSAPITILDSGAGISCFRKCKLVNGKIDNNRVIVAADGGKLYGPTVGTAHIMINGVRFLLKEVLVHSGLKNNLISTERLMVDNGVEIYMKEGRTSIIKEGKEIAFVVNNNGLLKVDAQCIDAMAVGVTSSIHERLAHINNKYIYDAIKNNYISLANGKDKKKVLKCLSVECDCLNCRKAKSTLRSLNKHGGNKYDQLKPRDEMHWDLVETRIETFNGSKYSLCGVDAATRFKVAIPVKTKDEVAYKLIEYNKQLINTYGKGMVRFFSDNGTEFKGEWLKYMADTGIIYETSPPRRPAINGLIERTQRTIVEAARAMLIQSSAPQQLWSYAITHAVQCINAVQKSPVGKGSAFQVFTGKKTIVNTDWLKIFGSDAEVHIPSVNQGTKFDSKLELAVYIGTDSNKMLVLNPVNKKIYKSESVTVNDGQFTIARELKASLSETDDTENDKLFIDFLKEFTAETENIEIAINKSLNDNMDTSTDEIIEEKKDDQSQDEPDNTEKKKKKKLNAVEKVQQAENERQEKLKLIIETVQRRSTRVSRPEPRLGLIDPRDMAEMVECHYRHLLEDDFTHAGEEDLNVHETIAYSVESDRIANRRACEETTVLTEKQLADRIYKNGQIIMSSQRCTSNNCKGLQCGAKTKNGQYCWNHLRSHNNLRIKKSLVPNGGKGLFATKDFDSNTEVTKYTGDLTKSRDESPNSSYLLELSPNVIIDAARTNTDSGRMINDKRGTGKQPNCKFVYDRKRKRLTIRTIKAVKNGEEFLMAYGNEYWNWMRQHLHAKKQWGRKQVPTAQPANGVELAESVNNVNIDIAAPDPTNAEKALNDPIEGVFWKQGKQREIDAHLKNGTFEAKPYDSLPIGMKAVGLKFLFKRKRLEKSLINYKVRMVAQGCQQQIDDGLDDATTYAPVLSFKVLRVLLALAAMEDLEIRQLDVKTAFLLADIGEEVYCKAPPGWPGTTPGQFLRVIKAIYGLRRAPKAWNDMVKSQFKSMGFNSVHTDNCLFIKRSKTDKLMILAVFVDDILCFSSKEDKIELEGVISEIKAKWPINDLGDAKQVLGMEIVRDRENRSILIKQEAYISKLLKTYNMDACKVAHTPGVSDKLKDKYKSNKDATMDLDDDTQQESELINKTFQIENFGKYVGALLYVAITSHPEIQHAVMVLTKKLQSAEFDDLVKVKRVLRYLKGVKHMGLYYSKGDSERPTLTAFSDSDWAGDVVNRRSTTGNAIMLGNGVVSWTAKQQPIVAQSSTEAEFIAANEAAREIVWMRMLLAELDYEQEDPTELLLDNQTAMAMVKDDGQYNKRKHIAVKYFYIREQVAFKAIDVTWIDTQNQLADIFTKALPIDSFVYLAGMITGMAYASNIITDAPRLVGIEVNPGPSRVRQTAPRRINHPVITESRRIMQGFMDTQRAVFKRAERVYQRARAVLRTHSDRVVQTSNETRTETVTLH